MEYGKMTCGGCDTLSLWQALWDREAHASTNLGQIASSDQYPAANWFSCRTRSFSAKLSSSN